MPAYALTGIVFGSVQHGDTLVYRYRCGVESV
jgi:hypothetical protein